MTWATDDREPVAYVAGRVDTVLKDRYQDLRYC
jgi:hypothetical protein